MTRSRSVRSSVFPQHQHHIRLTSTFSFSQLHPSLRNFHSQTSGHFSFVNYTVITHIFNLHFSYSCLSLNLKHFRGILSAGIETMVTVAGSKNEGTFKGLILMMIAVSIVAMGAEASPHIRETELDPTDICLFTCDSCYTGETLVRCANECVVLGGDVGPLMRATCPYFEQNSQPLFALKKNKPHK